MERSHQSVAEIKETLPTIRVKYPDGTVKYARVTGRLLKFPRLVIVGDMVYFETSWSAVTRAANNNTPILI